MQQTKTVPEQILDALAHGPKTKPQLAKLLEQRYDTINTNMRRLIERGRVERVHEPDTKQPTQPFPFWYARVDVQEVS